MLKIKGALKLRGNYEVELDMTESEFDALSSHEQDDVVSSAIDWRNWLDNSDLDDLDIDDVEEEKK